MLAEALRTLYGYSRWATERVLDAATGPPAETRMPSFVQPRMSTSPTPPMGCGP